MVNKNEIKKKWSDGCHLTIWLITTQTNKSQHLCRKSTNSLNHRFQRTSIIKCLWGNWNRSYSDCDWAGGGVIFTPSISSHEAKEMIADLRDKSESDRGLARWLHLPARFAQRHLPFEKYWAHQCCCFFMDQKIDAYDSSNKGVPLAKCSCQCPQCSIGHCAAVTWKLRRFNGQRQLCFRSYGDRIEKMFLFKTQPHSRQSCLDRGWFLERRRNCQRDD